MRRVAITRSRALRGASLLAAASTAAVALASDVGVPVDIVDRREHYEVQATDAVGLGREMAQRGPQHPTGRRAWAYTMWELRARYAVEPGDGGCRLMGPAVVLEVTTTLPHWRPAAPTRARLRSTWQRMLANAASHEATHREHAVDAARSAALEIARVDARESCAQVEGGVRAALRRASAEAARRSRLFDQQTDYGRRGGVRLGD